MKLEIFCGNPSQEELAALVAALQVLRLRAQARLTLQQPEAGASSWLLSERLQHMAPTAWGMSGSAWQRSERLANPWLD